MDEEETIDFFDLIDEQYEELVQERLINGYYNKQIKNK
tara:strand:- start:1434 stop:1547 length:114 start_codon:yes stop_codon:yes gene_type:complete